MMLFTSPATLATVPIAPHIRRLREVVGNELLVLPSAAVLPRDEAGAVLLVRVADTGEWAAIGGAVEPDESPGTCALREAREEANVELRLGRVLAVLGGPEYRVTYPNGDRTAYVSTVFDATVDAGTPAPDGDETIEVGWWDPDRLPIDEMSSFTRALVGGSGLTAPVADAPLLVLVTGLQGTGKSTVAELVAGYLAAPLLGHDWAMSGLRPWPSLQHALDRMEPPGHRAVGWSVLGALARAHLRRGMSVVVDGIADTMTVADLQGLADQEGARLVVLVTECSEVELHRSRIENRDRRIPGWYELDWEHVERARDRWVPVRADLILDAAASLAHNRDLVIGHLQGLVAPAPGPINGERLRGEPSRTGRATA